MTFQAWSRRLIVDREPVRDDSVAKRVNIWVCSEGQLVYTVINLNSAHSTIRILTCHTAIHGTLRNDNAGTPRCTGARDLSLTGSWVERNRFHHFPPFLTYPRPFDGSG